MKEIILRILTFILVLTACVKENKGSIYGVVTDFETAEPMRAAGVSLFVDGELLLKTVTYNDGHFEFNDLKAGTYKISVESDGRDTVTETVRVEAGRTARADIQMKVAALRLEVTTLSPRKHWYEGDNGEVFYYWSLEGRVRCPNNNNDIYPFDYGFVFSSDRNLTLDNNNPTTYSIQPSGVSEDESTFTIIFEGETHGHYSPNSIYDYYVRAYAINEHGIYYGESMPTK